METLDNRFFFYLPSFAIMMCCAYGLFIIKEHVGMEQRLEPVTLYSQDKRLSQFSSIYRPYTHIEMLLYLCSIFFVHFALVFRVFACMANPI